MVIQWNALKAGHNAMSTETDKFTTDEDRKMLKYSEIST